MKKLMTTFTLLLGFLFIQAQTDAISLHFSEFQSDKNFTSVHIGKKMFEMLSNADIEMNDADSEALADIIKNLEGLRILSTDKAPADFYKRSKSTLVKNKFEELMTVKDGAQDIHFFVQEDERGIRELVLLTSEGREVVLMSFLGNLDLNNISRLSKTLDIDGAEHLEKLKERQ